MCLHLMWISNNADVYVFFNFQTLMSAPATRANPSLTPHVLTESMDTRVDVKESVPVPTVT